MRAAIILNEWKDQELLNFVRIFRFKPGYNSVHVFIRAFPIIIIAGTSENNNNCIYSPKKRTIFQGQYYHNEL